MTYLVGWVDNVMGSLRGEPRLASNQLTLVLATDVVWFVVVQNDTSLCDSRHPLIGRPCLETLLSTGSHEHRFSAPERGRAARHSRQSQRTLGPLGLLLGPCGQSAPSSAGAELASHPVVVGELFRLAHLGSGQNFVEQHLVGPFPGWI